MNAFIPSTPQALAEQVVSLCESHPTLAVVALDGADCANPAELARLIGVAAESRQRPSAVVSLHDYVRPASLRLEFGHEDPLSYRTMWFDYDALDREVVTGARVRRTWLPQLWDEVADRSARSSRLPVHDRTVIVVAGPMLLGRGLDFDVTVRLNMSEAALRRHTPPTDLWTVDALLEYRGGLTDRIDLDVRYDHPARPAVRTH
ncbi:hypothetical protein ACFRFQ_07485 [Rhodococcus sp. NPDC056743]|uniref:hypothetical protein n=1 Tax=Rhodococcus sp. NPDC056743 TaxID=3345934 RepID=UPI00366CDB89